ncbi:uncharacterized protein LOC135818381 [Sycon ciliatum]|uniref:uncharacterized protein LOC135818381 n=1 Tax=Sycon ciliatum TaxID=27933 RepID=UPI0031F6F409
MMELGEDDGGTAAVRETASTQPERCSDSPSPYAPLDHRPDGYNKLSTSYPERSTPDLNTPRDDASSPPGRHKDVKQIGVMHRILDWFYLKTPAPSSLAAGLCLFIIVLVAGYAVHLRNENHQLRDDNLRLTMKGGHFKDRLDDQQTQNKRLFDSVTHCKNDSQVLLSDNKALKIERDIWKERAAENHRENKGLQADLRQCYSQTSHAMQQSAALQLCEVRAQMTTLNTSLMDCAAQRSETTTHFVTCIGNLHYARIQGLQSKAWIQKHMHLFPLYQQKLTAARGLIKKKDDAKESCMEAKSRHVEAKQALSGLLAAKERVIARLTVSLHRVEQNNQVLSAHIHQQHRASLQPYLDSSHDCAVSLACYEDKLARLTVWAGDRTARALIRDMLRDVGDHRIRIVNTLRNMNYEFPNTTEAVVTADKLLISEEAKRPFTMHVCPEDIIAHNDRLERMVYPIVEWIIRTFYDQETLDLIPPHLAREHAANSGKPVYVRWEVPTFMDLPSVLMKNVVIMGPYILVPFLAFLCHLVATGKCKVSEIPKIITRRLLFRLFHDMAVLASFTTGMPIFLWSATRFPFMLRWLLSILCTTIKTALDSDYEYSYIMLNAIQTKSDDDPSHDHAESSTDAAQVQVASKDESTG